MYTPIVVRMGTDQTPNSLSRSCEVDGQFMIQIIRGRQIPDIHSNRYTSDISDPHFMIQIIRGRQIPDVYSSSLSARSTAVDHVSTVGWIPDLHDLQDLHNVSQVGYVCMTQLLCACLPGGIRIIRLCTIIPTNIQDLGHLDRHLAVMWILLFSC